MCVCVSVSVCLSMRSVYVSFYCRLLYIAVSRHFPFHPCGAIWATARIRTHRNSSTKIEFPTLGRVARCTALVTVRSASALLFAQQLADIHTHWLATYGSHLWSAENVQFYASGRSYKYVIFDVAILTQVVHKCERDS